MNKRFYGQEYETAGYQILEVLETVMKQHLFHVFALIVVIRASIFNRM